MNAKKIIISVAFLFGATSAALAQSAGPLGRRRTAQELVTLPLTEVVSTAVTRRMPRSDLLTIRVIGSFVRVDCTLSHAFRRTRPAPVH